MLFTKNGKNFRISLEQKLRHCLRKEFFGGLISLRNENLQSEPSEYVRNLNNQSEFKDNQNFLSQLKYLIFV